MCVDVNASPHSVQRQAECMVLTGVVVSEAEMTAWSVSFKKVVGLEEGDLWVGAL